MKKGILLLLCLFTLSGILYSAESKFVVVIDPGHGGRDAGAVRGKYKEKDINLAVALEFGNLIKKNMKDVKVIYTRSTDVFIELDDRAIAANKAKANLFISIHTNSTAAKKTTAAGADTYILGLARSAESLEAAKRENSVILLEDDYKTKYEGFDPNSPESYIIFEFMANKYMEQSLNFASTIQTEFKSSAKRVDRGVKQAGFLVLRKSSMPSVLIELGFINNATEAAYLSSKQGQRTMATAIYSGFRKYKINLDKRQGGGNSHSSNTEEYNIENDNDTTDVPTEGGDPTNVVVEHKEQSKPDNTEKKGAIEYRVQILYSDSKLPNNSPQFKGLSPVDYYIENGYKYTYGKASNFDEIQKVLKRVKLKFKDAFVVRVQDGKRVK